MATLRKSAKQAVKRAGKAATRAGKAVKRAKAKAGTAVLSAARGMASEKNLRRAKLALAGADAVATAAIIWKRRRNALRDL